MNSKSQGACYDSNGDCTFTIFAPKNRNLTLRLTQKETENHTMEMDSFGYHTIKVKNCSSNMQYCYLQDNEICLPDPASRYQPNGITGPSRTVNHFTYNWRGDSFAGISAEDMIIYETHIGTFTDEGNFNSAQKKLDHLQKLGINALLLMPTAQYAGSRDWGYLNVFPFAVHNSYGTPDEFKNFIRACHKKQLAVVLELSLSSITPFGNILCTLAPFGSSCHLSQEGPGINFDGRLSYGIREFYIQAILSWLNDYHVDGLKIACENKIIDKSPIHFLAELSERVHDFEKESGKSIVLITENSCGGTTAIKDYKNGGYNFDALCSEDFHNAVFAAISKKNHGIYSEYNQCGKIAETFQKGRCFHGEFSKTRGKYFGQPGDEEDNSRLIVYSLDHKLAGKNPGKSRIAPSLGFEGAKLAAGATLLTPFIPLIFMGEEFGAKNCFNFFSSSDSKKLTNKLLQIRRDEVAIFNPDGDIPDPESESTFMSSKLNWDESGDGQAQQLLNLYTDIIRLRTENPALKKPCPHRTQVLIINHDAYLVVRNCGSNIQIMATFFNFSDQSVSLDLKDYLPGKIWLPELCSDDYIYGGSTKILSPYSCADPFYQPPRSFTVLKMLASDSIIQPK